MRLASWLAIDVIDTGAKMKKKYLYLEKQRGWYQIKLIIVLIYTLDGDNDDGVKR